MNVRISDKAVVESSAIGAGTVIDEFAIVRAGAVIGRNVHLHPYVIVGDGVEIGDDVEVFPGAFIGKAHVHHDQRIRSGRDVAGRVVRWWPF